MKYAYHQKLLMSVLLLLTCLCSLEIREHDPFVMRFVGHSSNTIDTVSVFSPLRFVFTRPISDSTVPVLFNPGFSDFFGHVNTLRDSFTITITGQLQGATRYVLRRKEIVQAQSGALLYPYEDSLTFYTWPSEQEPNNNSTTTDLLGYKIDGSTTIATDVDFYRVGDTLVRAVALECFFESKNAFSITDSLGRSVLSELVVDISRDTVFIPDTFVKPLLVKVFPLHASGGRYELTILR